MTLVIDSVGVLSWIFTFLTKINPFVPEKQDIVYYMTGPGLGLKLL